MSDNHRSPTPSSSTQPSRIKYVAKVRPKTLEEPEQVQETASSKRQNNPYLEYKHKKWTLLACDMLIEAPLSYMLAVTDSPTPQSQCDITEELVLADWEGYVGTRDAGKARVATRRAVWKNKREMEEIWKYERTRWDKLEWEDGAQCDLLLRK